MRALRLRARAKEVDAAVLNAVQALCSSWWGRWNIAGGDDEPSIRIQSLDADEGFRTDPDSPSPGFAEIDDEGVGYAISVADATTLVESVIGRRFNDANVKALFAEKILLDLVESFRKLTAIQPSAHVVDSDGLSGPLWSDPRTSARKFALERNGSLLVRGHLSAVAVDALGPEPACASSAENSSATLDALHMIEAACQVHLHLEGLKWSELAHCKEGDLLLGKHGLEAPATILVEGQTAPLSMQLYDLDGEWCVRVN